MQYKMNKTGKDINSLDRFADQENTVFVRIYCKGRFVNYFFDTADVENLGLGNIFDTIDPDPDLVQAKKAWAEFGVENKKVLAKPAKKKQAKLVAAR
jgi:hypothetical protein